MGSTSSSPYNATIIFGPTGVGKTNVLEQGSLHNYYQSLGNRFQSCEVISADSRQIYKDFPIATAMPSQALMAKIPHHLVSIKEYHEPYTVYEFVDSTMSLIREIHNRGNYPLVVGGTAYYLYHLCMGLPSTPKVSKEIRDRLQLQLNELGEEAMYNMLVVVDEEFASTIAATDTYRILRGLEVYEQTGKPLSSFAANQLHASDSNCIIHDSLGDIQLSIFGLQRERPILYQRIDQRVDEMFDEGLEREIYSLWKKGLNLSHNAAHTIGVQEFLQSEEIIDSWQQNGYLSDILISEAKELIKRNSRRYAKRQLTFFRKISRVNTVQWIDIEEETLSQVWSKFIIAE